MVFDNKMWVFGGKLAGISGNQNDVLYSEDGENWTYATESAAWSERAYHHESVVFDNKMWVIGSNDVWCSTDGVNWECKAESTMGWAGRRGFTCVVYDNKMWIIGGTVRKNDVWSSSNGRDWICDSDSAQWLGRHEHASVVFNNKMWISGGECKVVWSGGSSIGPVDDVWYAPAVTDISNNNYVLSRDAQLFSVINNSFANSLDISYTLKSHSLVKIGIYNSSGRELATVCEKQQGSGFHCIKWDLKNDLGKTIPTGIYYVRLETGQFTKAKKVYMFN